MNELSENNNYNKLIDKIGHNRRFLDIENRNLYICKISYICKK